ncbi:MAG: type II toxin-antitoxin system VapC family toxin [Desulfococcus multivorans]|jgi:PIN domain nuclease of toxin-antitoxin system|nr:type II toxin-antitoxin system VapC family toxin [Desulfococcus multivorans]
MIVLDTHIWLWWINREEGKLDLKRVQTIEEEENIAVSIISCFEVAWLERHNRITLPCDRLDWYNFALAGSGIECLPLSPSIVSCAVDLPDHHNDPHDRLIIATAIHNKALLMSGDHKFKFYRELDGNLC